MAVQSLSSSFAYDFTYDVYLSFRGADTRRGFTSYLYKALCNRGINTFIDDRELQVGDEITPSLIKAIQHSRIFIPVFSDNYASSSFCLDELVHIVDRFEGKGRMFLPVFYDVDPSHVQNQTGRFGEGFVQLEKRFQNDMERLRKWKMALYQAANLSGGHFILGNQFEYDFIGKIVEEVSNKIDHVLLHVKNYTYDVFLSFRGIDTRHGFTGNLYKALYNRGIRTFMDDRELQGGDEITPSLIKAIEGSRIFIPIFSVNYAASSFCLDELVRIVHCFEGNGGRLLVPVFYDVDPTHVRHQTGSYGEGLAKLEERFKNNMERLQRWKMALDRAASLSGHHFNLRTEYEHKFIEKIVEVVSKKINRVLLHVADYPVGLEYPLLQVKSLLDVGSDCGVCMLGIHGTGGMGKRTLARAVYNLIADQFECLCFLHNVREKSAKHGLEHLQEKLLSKTVALNIKLGDVSEGIPIIMHRLQTKKVLLILDDVDKLEQLQVMAGGLNWFGPGSRVIITTRDKQLLSSHGIHKRYQVDKLNGETAHELFRWKAFKNHTIHSSYEDILNRAISYAGGLPLAIEVVGSNLFGKHKEEWKSILDMYERIPNKEIQKILKVSFDALEEDVQSVFLDIACCFKEYELEELEHILCAHHGQCMKHHIGVLVEKSLIEIQSGSRDIVTLHDLIEDMGKEIIRQESPKEPGKRSRLWFHEDIVQVFEENSGTSKIEIVYLKFPLSEEEEEVEWEGDALKKMENLKTLIIKNGRFSRSSEHLPNTLRVFEWPGYPSHYMPSDFRPRNLSICNLPGSGLITFGLPGSLKKRFKNMKELNLDNCRYLTSILDISGLQNLEVFSFRKCENLITVHDSIGFLSKLKILDAYGCCKLRRFPPLKLTSLDELNLSCCKNLENFPEILGEMKNIRDIFCVDTSIKEFPSSFQNLTRLHTLRIWGRGKKRLQSSNLMMPKLLTDDAEGGLLPKQDDKLSYVVSSNVEALGLPKCNPSNEFLPIILTWLANIQNLDLSGNDFTILPECLKECHFLRIINLNDCKFLEEIRGIPPKLIHLYALHCKSLTSSCRRMLLNQELHESGETMFHLAGTARIPEWFEHRRKGPSISFWFRKNLPSAVLCIVCKSMHNKCPNSEFLSLKVNLFLNDYEYDLSNLMIKHDHTQVYDLQLSEVYLRSKVKEALLNKEWIHAKVTYEGPAMKSLCIKSGIHIFKGKTSMEDIQFTNPSL